MTGLCSETEVKAGTGSSSEPGAGRDGLEPVLRARTGPGSESGFREVTGQELELEAWAVKGPGP